METKSHKVAPTMLLLDPNNYRFHDVQQYKRVVNKSRYGEEGVQTRALYLLQSTDSFDLDGLKDSISTNGYVPLERIVVVKFDENDTGPRYLVIEGNRRVAAIKLLLSEYEAGATDISEGHLATLRELPAIEIIGTDEEREEYQQTLMAIRHIAGIKEWGPYQQARLVVELYEKEAHQFLKVAQRIGISAQEVGRRYRASKALEQMEADDEFGEYAEPRLYSFFHEAVSQPKVRQWLGFSDDSFQAEDEESRRGFYELLSPREVDGERISPKLQNANRQVRQLKDIVDKEGPLKILLDPEKSFEDAVKAAEMETIPDESGVLETSIAHALQALRTPSVEAWFEASEQSRKLWPELVKLVENVKGLMGDNDASPNR
jgi:hypothetical protein